MPSQQPHAGDVIRRPGFQRKTSCGHAALDIRDRKISHQGPRARLPKTRRQPETGGRVCRYGGGGSLCHGKELERQEGILVIIRVAQTVSGIHKSRSEERRVGKECRSRWWTG